MILLNDFTLLLHGLKPESKYWAAALYQNTPTFRSWLSSFPRHCQKRRLALTRLLQHCAAVQMQQPTLIIEAHVQRRLAIEQYLAAIGQYQQLAQDLAT